MLPVAHHMIALLVHARKFLQGNITDSDTSISLKHTLIFTHGGSTKNQKNFSNRQSYGEIEQ